MYKYKAKLLSNDEIIAQANTIEELEGQIKGFRRGQKHGLHTKANEKIEIIRVERNHLEGKEASKEVILKVV
ncbi:MAG6790 family protein [Mycoplasma sp. T193]|uniref:MAG6790 family protein n=1 Tax=Mycoplasma sp. T193 TaxID=3401666 RepID=UPI003AACC192